MKNTSKNTSKNNTVKTIKATSIYKVKDLQGVAKACYKSASNKTKGDKQAKIDTLALFNYCLELHDKGDKQAFKPLEAVADLLRVYDVANGHLTDNGYCKSVKTIKTQWSRFAKENDLDVTLKHSKKAPCLVTEAEASTKATDDNSNGAKTEKSPASENEKETNTPAVKLTAESITKAISYSELNELVFDLADELELNDALALVTHINKQVKQVANS